MWVAASVAQSIDGKIATNNNPGLRLGSDLDLERLRARRSEFDAVLVGGNTFRSWPIPYSTSKSIHNLVLSRRSLVDLTNKPERWAKVGVTLHCLTPEGGYPDGVCWAPAKAGVQDVIKYCLRLGVSRLLIEGGGGLLSAFVEHHPIQELFVTLCPKLVGGADSPTLFDGVALDSPKRYRKVDSQMSGDEIFLRYQLRGNDDTN